MEPRSFRLLRSSLIGYGVLLLGYVLGRSDPGPSGRGLHGISIELPLGGIALQVLLVFASRLIRRRLVAPDRAEPLIAMLELIGDGVTVLLFAIATFGILMQAAYDL
jgi:hypothetical protein